MIKLALFGSTGSVGRQTLEVIDAFPGEVEVVALAARRSSQKLLLQAQKYRPSLVVSEEEPAREWFEHLPRGTEYLRGDEGLREAVKLADRVMNAISGVHGIKPAYYTLREGKTLLASNKESILCLAELVSENRERILPVDSEHNALFQLMEGKRKEDIKFMYLTASGGPFRNWS
ncbi:MAG TPA: 1-deoxy-D-xylulose-5-phosphate reductoisomerase, partial [Aquifex aeolicus]|nr:1-deoxy-D-xylulose-5-phosphate reductoisomerase [Aquifex aeolicus]